MKTASKKKIETVTLLREVLDQKKELAAKEKQLKEMIKEFMGDCNMLEAGEWVVFRTTRTRKDIDKELLATIIDIKEVQKTSSYEILEVKNAK
jgi:hypothetical protein